MSGRRFKTAFILGAGLGMRLRPLTEHCPKPLLPLGGRPLITHIMDRLLSVGVERFIVNTHHCPEVYLREFPDSQWRGAPIIFRHEPVLLDTAGGLKNIEDLLDKDEAILCHNGDVLSEIPLRKLLDFHEQKGSEATMLLRSSGPLLNVSINEKNEICDLRNALKNPGIFSCLFTGIYVLEKSILQHIEPGIIESIIPIFIKRIIDKPGSLMGIVIDDGAWHDIGSIEEYDRLRSAADTQEGE
jgi:mannose-1-phosphate guanylyltransferase